MTEFKSDLKDFIGYVERIVYFSDGGYVIARTQNQLDHNDITVAGYMGTIVEGKYYLFEGEMEDHKKYKEQFRVKKHRPYFFEGEENIYRYLSDYFTADQIDSLVKKFGNNLLNKIAVNIDILLELDFVNEDIKNNIVRDLGLKDEQREFINLLSKCKINTFISEKIHAIYGKKAHNLVAKNPYIILDDIEDLDFKKVDKLAEELNFKDEEYLRLEAAVLFAIKNECNNSGDTYVTIDIIIKEFRKLVRKEEHDLFEFILDKLINSKRVIKEDDFYFHHRFYAAEMNIASILLPYANKDLLISSKKHLNKMIAKVEKRELITFADNQKQAIIDFTKHNLMFLTGGPGTGKTTIVKAIIQIYKQMFHDHEIAIVAPTGRAAKRLTEVTGNKASTIHSLLKWDVKKDTFLVNENNPLEMDFLIIDEFSMVDALLFEALLKAAKMVKKILIIGDEKQLPSVSPGNVLCDLIESGLFHVVELNQIYRQAEKSGIIQIAHKIRNNETVTLNDFDKYDDVAFYPININQTSDYITFLINRALTKNFNEDNIQVLTPIYASGAGVEYLNRILREIFNPKIEDQKEITFFNHSFREKDRILHLKNRPDDNVFNGDIGKIINIQLKNKELDEDEVIVANFEPDVVDYSPNQYDQLIHAYAMTIHKSQGSEFEIVILPIFNRFNRMLYKKLIYTGITRAKKSLVIVGEIEAFNKACNELGEKPRNTRLKHFLKEKEKNRISLYDFI